MRGVLAAFAALLWCQSAAGEPTTPEAWRAAAAQDLDAIKTGITADTPIGAGAAGPSYDLWLTQGYGEAQARLGRVTDRLSYYYTLGAYVNGFRDPHLSLAPAQALPAPRWPGFVASRQGQGIFVAWRDAADAAAPPLGARIVSCDGEDLEALIQRDVYAFVLNPALPDGRRRAAPRLFIDTGNPYAAPPQACVFQIGQVTRTIRLIWRPAPNPPMQFNAAFSEAGLGPSAVSGLETPAPGITWIGAPTFAADSPGGDQLGPLMNEVTIHAVEMRAGRAIVVDLRGNSGGSSEWAQRLAQGVFGADYVAHLPLANPNGAALWRASASNLTYWQDFNVEVERQRSASTRRGAMSRDIVDGLSRALGRHEPLWRQGARNDASGGGLTLRRPHGPSPFAAQIYVLSNGSCVSSCLDFADIALQIPGVILIGAPTSADSLLADVRGVTLPSGQARFVFPQKIMVGRGRAAMEFYTPDIAYDGPWSDAAVRAFVLQTINSQTASH